MPDDVTNNDRLAAALDGMPTDQARAVQAVLFGILIERLPAQDVEPLLELATSVVATFTTPKQEEND